MVAYEVNDVSPDMSFLEMLDVLNEQLIARGRGAGRLRPRLPRGHLRHVRLMINGVAHGPSRPPPPASCTCGTSRTATTIDVEPWRAAAFPVMKDLVVDRGAFDRIIQAGGYISAPTGAAPDANAHPVPKDDADARFDAAACIGCGACVAACPNASAMLFTSRQGRAPGLLPQGQPERDAACSAWSSSMDDEGFGGCTNIGECAAACPKGISVQGRSPAQPRTCSAPLPGRGTPPRLSPITRRRTRSRSPGDRVPSVIRRPASPSTPWGRPPGAGVLQHPRTGSRTPGGVARGG